MRGGQLQSSDVHVCRRPLIIRVENVYCRIRTSRVGAEVLSDARTDKALITEFDRAVTAIAVTI